MMLLVIVVASQRRDKVRMKVHHLGRLFIPKRFTIGLTAVKPRYKYTARRRSYS